MGRENSRGKATAAAQYGATQRWTKYSFWSIYWSTRNVFKTSLITLKDGSISKGKKKKKHPRSHAWIQSPPKRLWETRPTGCRGTSADRRTALSADPAKRSALIRSPISATRIQPSTGSLPRAKLPARERHASSPLICYLLKVSAFEPERKWLIGGTLLH